MQQVQLEWLQRLKFTPLDARWPKITRLIELEDVAWRLSQCWNVMQLDSYLAIGNESVPKIIINNTVDLFLKLQLAFW